jgi:hypothetical protein
MSPVSYRLQLPVGTKSHDVFHASILKPYHGDANTARATIPPLPVIMQDGEEEFEVKIYHQSPASAWYVSVPDEVARLAAIGVNVGRPLTPPSSIFTRKRDEGPP